MLPRFSRIQAWMYTEDILFQNYNNKNACSCVMQTIWEPFDKRYRISDIQISIPLF